MSNIRAVTIFGSSTCEADSPEYLCAHEIALKLAESVIQLIHGGKGGVMYAVTHAAIQAGKPSTAILRSRESQPNNLLTPADIYYCDSHDPAQLSWVQGMGDRLTQLTELGDAYVVIDGASRGSGTYTELAFALQAIEHGPKVARKRLAILHPGKDEAFVYQGLNQILGGSFLTSKLKEETPNEWLKRRFGQWVQVFGSKYAPDVNSAKKFILGP